MSHRNSILVLVAGSVLACVAQLARSDPPNAADSVANGSMRIAERLKDPDPTAFGARLNERESLVRFYARRANRPAWTEPDVATALDRAVGDAYTHGLDPQDYHAGALAADAPAHDADAAAQRDLLRSDAFIHLGRHLGGGRVDPSVLHAGYTRGDTAPDPVPALEAFLPDGDPAAALAALAPPHPEYTQLRSELAVLRAEPAEAVCSGLPNGPLVRPGERQARVVRLRACLIGRESPADPSRLDATLVAALRDFQRRHGLVPDGILGPLTTAALVETGASRIARVRANLERWRWQPRDFGSRAVRVEIPQYRLRAFVGETPELEMRAIVGCGGWRTPLVHSAIESLVLNPAWQVPRSIFVKEMLPRARRNPGYFARNGLELVEDRNGEHRAVDPAAVDWAGVDPAVTALRAWQRPGPGNPLGRIKFDFPSAYGVFLHGTPGRAAFELPVRALSHGCVRIEDERALALFALAPEATWTADALEEALQSANQRRVALREPLAVHLLYFTAEVDALGELSLAPDPYGWDARLIEALDARAH